MAGDSGSPCLVPDSGSWRTLGVYPPPQNTGMVPTSFDYSPRYPPPPLLQTLKPRNLLSVKTTVILNEMNYCYSAVLGDMLENWGTQEQNTLTIGPFAFLMFCSFDHSC